MEVALWFGGILGFFRINFYHSYNYKHQQHIILYIGHIITEYQNINFTYQKNAYFILEPKTSLYQNFASFNVLFIQKHKKYHCLKQIQSSSREIGDLFLTI